MPSNYIAVLKKVWADPVWSKVIAGTILTLGTLLVALVIESRPNPPQHAAINIPQLPAVAGASQRSSPITLETLKNLTYQIEEDRITLNDGKREFNPEMSSGIHEKAIAVYLAEYAFGDLDGDGNMDAVVVLQVSAGGGNGIYYYLALVYNDQGTPTVPTPSYVLGDRLEFRSIAVSTNSVEVEVLMHSSTDGQCCPTQFRHLKFSISNKALQCQTVPCTDA